MESNSNLDVDEYTVSARDRIREGVEASLRGELVPQEEIEAFFEDWKRELRGAG
jgi:predicted transcriptional regulator